MALKGARGIAVFDGDGEEREIGPLSVRFAPHADALLERLAAEHRATEVVFLVSSDAVASRHVRARRCGSAPRAGFLADLEPARHDERRLFRVEERVDDETRAALERLRRSKD